MERRNFTQLVGISGLGLLSSNTLFAMKTNVKKYSFNLAYAPHLGMFSHHAGDDPIDQLNFMADQGFSAF